MTIYSEGLRLGEVLRLKVGDIRTLVDHPHVHCVVPAGGLSPDKRKWVRGKNQNS